MSRIYEQQVFADTRLGYGYGAETDRAGLARLRRLRPRADRPDRLDVSPLAESWQASALLQRLKLVQKDGTPADGYRVERAAAALGALALINTRTSVHPARALRETMSEDRFTRLLRMETPAEVLANGRRTARMLDGASDPGTLGADLYRWGPAVRTRWAFLYHGHERDLPDALRAERDGDER